jgi:DNA repair ATPase RecN
LSSLREISERWISEIRAWTSQARELGILAAPIDPAMPIPSLVDALRGATAQTGNPAVATAEAIDGAIAELVGLQREESERSTALAHARRRLSEMEQLRDSTTAYGGQLYVQRDRLRIAEWMKELHAESHACPICGQDFANGSDTLTALLQALTDLEASATQVAGIPAAFDRELQRVGEELRRATEQLEGVRHRIRALTRASDAAKARQDATLQSARFLGRLEQALEHYERLGNDEGVAVEVATLRERVRILEAELREQDVAARTELALKRLASLVQPMLPKLDAERPADPVSFSISDLTVRVAGREREDYLWEIGSGSNWLAYLGLIRFGGRV